MDSLVIVDRLSRPNVYFSLCLSFNSGFSCYSGQFAADGRIQDYERLFGLVSRLFGFQKFEIIGYFEDNCWLPPGLPLTTSLAAIFGLEY